MTVVTPRTKGRGKQAPESIAPEAWPYRFEVLPIDKLFVDHSYQRPVTTFVARIAENFDPALVGTLVVSARESGDHAGEYAVVDGQSRKAGAELRDVMELPCLVYMGLSPAQEADLFARLQKERRGIASYYRFRAALVAGDEQTGQIQRIVNECGYEIGVSGSGPTVISAVAALEKVFRRGPDILERTMVTFKAGWADRYLPGGDHIRGLAYFLDRTEGVDDEKLSRRLSLASPEELKRRASALREGVGHGGGSEKYMAGAFEALYNRRTG